MIDVISDDYIKKLVNAGYTTAVALAAVVEEDLVAVLSKRGGVVGHDTTLVKCQKNSFYTTEYCHLLK